MRCCFTLLDNFAIVSRYGTHLSFDLSDEFRRCSHLGIPLLKVIIDTRRSLYRLDVIFTLKLVEALNKFFFTA